MKNAILKLLLFIFIGTFFIYCQESSEEAKIVTINVLNDSSSTVNGDTVLIKNLADKLETFDQKIFILINTEDMSIKMGVMHEVQRQMIKAKISYANDISKEELLKSVSN